MAKKPATQKKRNTDEQIFDSIDKRLDAKQICEKQVGHACHWAHDSQRAASLKAALCIRSSKVYPAPLKPSGQEYGY